jgi:hypothetical protein
MAVRIWKDVVTNPPPDQQVVTVRRFFNYAPPIPAKWDAANSQFLFGIVPYLIPWWAISHWRPLVAIGTPSEPPADRHAWRDPFLFEPPDSTDVWVRRFPPDTSLKGDNFETPGGASALRRA